jgi:hypothetical protein
MAAVSLTVAGCAAMPAPPPPRTAPPPAASPAGLERVLGRTARDLVALLGTPELDVREDRARKLQFAGPICVLDAYLYAKSAGEPVVTYVDARQPDGRDIDRASCVAALIANHQR